MHDNNRNWTSKIEEIEDLGRDGAPLPQQNKPRQRWELLLGGLLLLAVVVFGGYNWYREQTAHNLYLQAIASEQARDWDKAAAQFQQLGEYSDATSRAAHAAQQVQQRDKSYDAGIKARRQGDWQAAYLAFQQVAQVQPNFKDSATGASQALCELKANTLNGLVYQQNSAQKGLYVFMAAAPLLLANSDEQSRLRGVNATGTMLVFDGPGEKAGAQKAGGRRIMLATLDKFGLGDADNCVTSTPGGTRHWTVEQLPDTISGDGAATFTPDGLWWRTRIAMPQADQSDLSQGESWFYYSLQTRSVAPVILPGANWGILDFDPSSETLLLVEHSLFSVAIDSRTRLYLAGPDGADRRLVASTSGFVTSAHLSPGGASLVYSRRQAQNSVIGDNAALLGVIMGTQPGEQTIAAITVDTSDAVLDAFFLPGSAGERLLIKRKSFGAELLSVYDLRENKSYPVWTSAKLYPDDPQYFFSPDGRYLVFQVSDTNASSLVVQPLDGASAGVQEKLPVDSDWSPSLVTAVSFSGEHLIYTVLSYNMSTARNNVYSLNLTDNLKGQNAQPVNLFGVESLPLADSAAPQTAAPLPGALLAHIDADHNLYASTLDGKLTVPVATDTGGVWALEQISAQNWLPR